ncbi:MAG: hypothetical protein V9H69_10075 [Anaerolineae bacterium]
MTTITGSLAMLLPPLLKAPVIMPHAQGQRKGRCQHQNQRRPVAKHQSEVFPADGEKFGHGFCSAGKVVDW